MHAPIGAQAGGPASIKAICLQAMQAGCLRSDGSMHRPSRRRHFAINTGRSKVSDREESQYEQNYETQSN